MPIEFTLNGRPVSIAAPAPQWTLLDELRERGLTGAKEGCAEGECGACTVVVVAGRTGDAAAGSEYRAINSCLMFLPMAAHQEIHTIESLAVDGRLAEAQQAMAAAGGSQCGYCTPGFVMSLFAEQYRPGRTGPCDVHALAGNLCRCTGYRPIRDAALTLGPPPDDRFRDRMTRPAPELGSFSIDGFSRPSTVDECVAALVRDPAAVLVAGATDLGVEANLKARRWPHLISLEGIAELRDVTAGPLHGSRPAYAVRIGAAASLTDIGRRWRERPAAVDEWLTLFASLPIRNRATLGGNLATASPIGDAAPLLLALDATLDIAGPQGRRRMPLASFFIGYRRTALGPGELLVSIEIPAPLPQFLRFYKIAKRRFDDISTVAAAMAVDCDATGRVRRARFAFGGVAATPVRLTEAERAVTGELWNGDAVTRVQGIIDRTLSPMSDHRGSKEYRLQVSHSLVEKFWWERTA
jgi:xanthine dehydrogenase small subunit